MTSLFKRLVWGKPITSVLDDEPINVIRSESNDINEGNEDSEEKEDSEGSEEGQGSEGIEEKEDSEEGEGSEEGQGSEGIEEKEEGEGSEESEGSEEGESEEGESEENEDQTTHRDTSTFMDDFYTDIFTSPRFRMLCNLYAGLVLLSISATTYNLLSSDTNICDKPFASDSPATIIYIVFVNTPNLE